MAAETKRFQPYHGDDGDYRSLLDFALPAAQRLDPEFNPPKVLLSREDTEGMQDLMRFSKRWGNETQGFETTNIVELEPRASGEAVNRMQLRTIGLPEGCRLEMEAARVWYDPRYIEITVEGPEAVVQQIIADFSDQFGGTKMDPSKLKQTLVSAEVSLKAGAWDAAIMKAQEVIDLDPAQPDAYFVLGAGHMAKNDLEATVAALQQAVELQPGHFHAQLNLGMAYFRQGNFEAARGAFEAALAVDPDQPEALLQLAWAAERQGDAVAALDAYRRLMEAPPAPGGKDYLTLAVEGVGRVTGSIGGNG